MAVAFEDIDARRRLLMRRTELTAAIGTTTDAAPLAVLRADVDAALARMERGSYGLCEVCHDAIPAERLLADPLARTCLDCMTTAEQRALERDLDLASRIQRTLLPPTTFASAGWEGAYQYVPAGPASGDYVDLLPLSENETIFVVGDVSGKGVAASMLMAHLHAVFRSLVGIGLPFAQLVERANGIFHQSLGGQQYATLLCGLARRDGTIQVTNAGHCPPLVVRGNDAMTLPATGVPIGMFAQAPYPTLTVTLERGDALVVYTDGVTEALDADGQEYGADRLRAAAVRSHQGGLPELLAECVVDVDRFRGRTARQDDATLLVMRRASQ